ncbi:hypothetical protein EVAR_14703_1 [Eumeta japonica]|uniref:Uncharacterized protein n=1 Tax=Eumeta variegata TaxID=151549 RepID=A0A4C1U319_EUMVA|nr:hypothetical protein EVAR_14703_1 [Eumeta japonica]
MAHVNECPVTNTLVPGRAINVSEDIERENNFHFDRPRAQIKSANSGKRSSRRPALAFFFLAPSGPDAGCRTFTSRGTRKGIRRRGFNFPLKCFKAGGRRRHGAGRAGRRARPARADPLTSFAGDFNLMVCRMNFLTRHFAKFTSLQIPDCAGSSAESLM